MGVVIALLYEGWMVCRSYDSVNHGACFGISLISQLCFIKGNLLLGDNMEKWKELGKRKKFLIIAGVIVVIAVVGWVTGWWSSPEVPVQ